MSSRVETFTFTKDATLPKKREAAESIFDTALRLNATMAEHEVGKYHRFAVVMSPPDGHEGVLPLALILDPPRDDMPPMIMGIGPREEAEDEVAGWIATDEAEATK